MIQVVTHNGRLPRDGGRRLGYQVGWNFFPITGGGPFDARPPKPAPPPKPVIRYGELPMALHQDGECCKCRGYPNPSFMMQTDTGRQFLVECSKCKTLMRPCPLEMRPSLP